MKANFLPMQAAGVRHLIERTYREGGRLQWVRETYKNAEESDATKILYGIEWQGVESNGVYRRLIADNGCGMTGDELVAFFKTFGGGGKPIGGVHENFGVGSKTSLLAWNKHGVVVVSWKDGEANMIWIYYDEDEEEYGLKVEPVEYEDGTVKLDPVYEPYYDDVLELDWADIRPDWIQGQGTVIVLLGNDPGQNTVLGDLSRQEDDNKAITKYLNARAWTIPEGTTVQVLEFKQRDQVTWPPNQKIAFGSDTARRVNRRTIFGARRYIVNPKESYRDGRVAASGVVTLENDVKVRWWLWDGDRPSGIHTAAERWGYIGVVYKNELYDVSNHVSTYRSFGIGEPDVRKRVWLVIEPPESGKGEIGVYPRTDRNSLLIQGGPHAGDKLPISVWGAAFNEQLPSEIHEAIRACRGGDLEKISDEEWRKKIADRFGSRWRIPSFKLDADGDITVSPTHGIKSSKKRAATKKPSTTRSGTSGGASDSRIAQLGSAEGPHKARQTTVAGGMPTPLRGTAENMKNPLMMVSFQPVDPDHPEGVVYINAEHPIMRNIITYWQNQFPDHLTAEIETEVVTVYGNLAAAKIAHSERMKASVPTPDIEEKMRSDEALTIALLGCIAEDAVLSTRLGGKYRKKRTA